MKSLVIGATGIIGNHIVRELLAQGHEVVAASRGYIPDSNLEGLESQKIKLDLTDLTSLKKAFCGVDLVFMAAAYYPHNTFQRRKHVDKAMLLTNNVIEALKGSSVQKMIYTSSLTTIGRAHKGELASEKLSYDLYGRDPHPYFLVKHLCEQRLLDSVKKQNLPIVLVNPTGCFGPFELKPPHLCLIPQLINRKIPAFVKSDINVVDVSDVAKGHILAAQKGRVGERYVLGGHNLTTEMLIKEICELAKVKPPRLIVPMRLGLSVSYMNEAMSLILGRLPGLPILGLRFAQYGQHFSIDKAVNELGYKASAIEPCLEKAIAWYKQIGYC